MSRGVFSFSVAVFGTLGTWGTSEESTRERLAVLAFAAAAADEEEEAPLIVDEEELAAALGMAVTGLGGSACRIAGAAVLAEELPDELEYELDEATDAASFCCNLD